MRRRHCRDCCECRVCKSGIRGLLWTVGLDGFETIPEPGEGDPGPYMRVSNAEDLNTTVVFRDEDFDPPEKDGPMCRATSKAITIGAMQRETWDRVWDPIEEEWNWEITDEDEIEVEVYLYVVRNYASKTWTASVYTLVIWTLPTQFIEDVESGAYECDGYEATADLAEYTYNGLNFEGVAMTLSIARDDGEEEEP